MNSTVNFYSLEKTQDLDLSVCFLVRELYKLENQILIIDYSDNMKKLDKILWTFVQNSFIPHKIYEPNVSLDTPVILLSENYLDNLIIFNKYTSIINKLSEPIIKIKTKVKVFEFVEDDEQKKIISRNKYSIYKENNFEMNYKNIMNKQYRPKDIEKKIYNEWEQNKCFAPKHSASKFSIVLPPPNVTGTLHMGHAFQHTIIDVLVRYHRMLGKSVLWQPGTDHAGIATQLVVENRISSSGKNPKELSRKQFIDEVWKWKELSGNTIISQTKRLGSSADWSRNRFTMDEGLSDVVKKIFISLYKNKLIYRGKRLVNWDIKLQTAVSDLEVVNEETDGYLYHLEYKIKDSSESVIVATTRPETFFGDSAICINPLDDRYRHLIGKKVLLPLINRELPIIEDEIVDMSFGTGCLKVTPAHDFNDYKIGKKHNLEFINILNKDGTLNENVHDSYVGKNIHDIRETLLKDLDNYGVFVKKEPHKNTLPIGERTGEIIEPLLTNQWFMDMKDLAKEGISVVKDKKVNFVPEHWEKNIF